MVKRHVYPLIVASVLAIVLCLPRPAHADVAQTIQEIVETLIEDDVAQQVVPNAAKELPALCDFFPGSVQAMRDKRYAGLAGVSRKELADLAGLAVLLRVDSLANAQQQPEGSDEFFGTTSALDPATSTCKTGAVLMCQTLDKNNKPAGVYSPLSDGTPGGTLACRTGETNVCVNGLVHGLYKQSLRFLDAISLTQIDPGIAMKVARLTPSSGSDPVSTCSFDLANTKGHPVVTNRQSAATTVLDACLATQTSFMREASCTAALATRDAANGDKTLLPGDARRAAAAFGSLAFMTDKNIDKDYVGLCTAPKLTFENVVRALETVFSAKSTDAPAAIKQFVTTCTGSPVADPPSQAANDITALVQETYNIIQRIAGVDSSGAPSVEQILQALRDIATLNAKANIGKLSAAGVTLAQTIAAALAITDDALLMIRDIKAKNYGAAAGDAFDAVDEVIQTECNIVKPPSDPAKAAAATTRASYKAKVSALMAKQTQKQNLQQTRMFKANAQVAAPPTLSDASLPYDDALSEDPDSAPDVCGAISVKLRQFIKTATVYGIDAATAPNGSSDAAAAFKQAAVDLVEKSLQGAGVRRAKLFGRIPSGHAGDVAKAVFIPSFALRASVRPGHIGPGAANGAFMTYATIDFINLRGGCTLANWIYVGADISFIDVSGPLFEIGLRDPGLTTSPSSPLPSSQLSNPDTSNLGRVFASAFFVPRAEFEMGVPRLTQNLVLGLGVAARLYRATETGTSVTYCAVGDSSTHLNTSCSGSAFNLNNLEGSLFLKFVP